MGYSLKAMRQSKPGARVKRRFPPEHWLVGTGKEDDGKFPGTLIVSECLEELVSGGPLFRTLG